MIPALTSALHGLPLPGLALRGLALPGLALPGLAPSGLLMLAAITLTGMLIALLAHSARVAAAVTAIPQGRRAAPCARSPGAPGSFRSATRTRQAGPGPAHPRRSRRPPDQLCLT